MNENDLAVCQRLEAIADRLGIAITGVEFDVLGDTISPHRLFLNRVDFDQMAVGTIGEFFPSSARQESDQSESLVR